MLAVPSPPWETSSAGEASTRAPRDEDQVLAEAAEDLIDFAAEAAEDEDQVLAEAAEDLMDLIDFAAEAAEDEDQVLAEAAEDLMDLIDFAAEAAEDEDQVLAEAAEDEDQVLAEAAEDLIHFAGSVRAESEIIVEGLLSLRAARAEAENAEWLCYLVAVLVAFLAAWFVYLSGDGKLN